MNRIEVYYTTRKGNVGSNLEIRNDIKGYSNNRIGTMFFGPDADMMLDLLSNIDYSKLDNYMSYGIYINNQHIDIWKEFKRLTKLSDEELDNFFHRMDELEMVPGEYAALYKEYKREGKDVNTIFEDYETKGLDD